MFSLTFYFELYEWQYKDRSEYYEMQVNSPGREKFIN